MRLIKRMGSLGGLMKLIPGMNKIDDGMLKQGEEQLKKIEAMIGSMTEAERRDPDLLAANPSRRRRIAGGSGHTPADGGQGAAELPADARLHAADDPWRWHARDGGFPGMGGGMPGMGGGFPGMGMPGMGATPGMAGGALRRRPVQARPNPPRSARGSASSEAGHTPRATLVVCTPSG